MMKKNKKVEHYTASVVGDITHSPELFQFKNSVINANTEITPHQHPWGQLNIINNGVMEVALGNQNKLIAPWQYTIWIPARVTHASYNKQALNYCSLSVPLQESRMLPNYACMFELSEIERAIVNNFITRNVTILHSAADQKLAGLLIERLSEQKPVESFLPLSNDKYLKPIIDELQANPGNNMTLEQWSQQVFTSEKTLSRRCQQALGMSFREWKIRLRFLRAITLLKTPMGIQEIAFQLGYSNPSAFIFMFNKISGSTPNKYRKRFSDTP